LSAGAPLGNKNAAKSRLFEQAIIRALKQRDLKDGDGETLRKIAERLIELALEGQIKAFSEMRDTVDGKPMQSVEHSGPDGEAIPHKVEVILVRPDSA
jgi:hypothetical protein